MYTMSHAYTPGLILGKCVTEGLWSVQGGLRLFERFSNLNIFSSISDSTRQKQLKDANWWNDHHQRMA